MDKRRPSLTVQSTHSHIPVSLTERRYPSRGYKMSEQQRQFRDQLAAQEIARRLNRGETLEQIAEDRGVPLEMYQRLADQLFASYPEARSFKMPEGLDTRPLKAIHHAL